MLSRQVDPLRAQFYRDRQREESLDDDGDAFETLFRQQNVVAAILRHDSETDELEVASIGVGTKFLSSNFKKIINITRVSV